MGMSPREMIGELKKIKRYSILDFSITPLSSKSACKSKKLEKILSKIFGDRLIENLKLPFGCVAYDIANCREIEFYEGSLQKALRASASIPMIFRPVLKEGMVLVDGGLSTRLPVNQCRTMGADLVIAVDVMGKPQTVEKLKNTLDMAERYAEINDYHTFLLKSQQQKIDVLIEPEVGEVSPYAFASYVKMFFAGYWAAIDKLNDIVSLL